MFVRHNLGLIFFVATISGCGLQAHRKNAQRENHNVDLDADQCDTWSDDNWQAFLEQVASQEKLADTCEDSPCDAEFYAAIQEKAQHVVDKCGEVIAASPRLKQCTANLRRFLPAWSRQHDAKSYGFEMNNHEYLASETGIDKPRSMMVPPEALVKAIPELSKVQEVVRENGWAYLTHDSAIGDIRTFIFIPGPDGAYDQWLLLNSEAGKTKIDTDIPLSFIGVQKKAADGTPLQKVRLNFRDYTIVEDGDTTSIRLDETRNGKCYACHVSGVRQLIPIRTDVLESKPVKGEAGYSPDSAATTPKDFGLTRLRQLNDRLSSYGLPDWKGLITPEDFGPALGKDQGCSNCHNGKNRGVLTIATSIDQLEEKMYYELSMIPNSQATTLLERSITKNPPLSDEEGQQLDQIYSEHEKLTTDFENSRFPALRAWLLENACNGN